MFGNDDNLKKCFKESGEQINELVWEMPVDEYHENILRNTQADIASCQEHVRDGGSCQAAAFLKVFVEEGTKWIHLDIAGTVEDGNGYGSRILLQFVRNYVDGKMK